MNKHIQEVNSLSRNKLLKEKPQKKKKEKRKKSERKLNQNGISLILTAGQFLPNKTLAIRKH